MMNISEYIDRNTKFVDVKGVNTRYFEKGKGRPVIFLHGCTGSLESFYHNLLELSKFFRVIAIDMIGHGFTDKPNISYSPKTLADHVINFSDTMGIGSFSLVGHAWGGWISTLIAFFNEHRVDKVVSICGLPSSSLAYTLNSKNKKMMDSLTIKAVTNPSLENIRERMKVMFKFYDDDVESLALLRSKYYSLPGFSNAMRSLIENSWKGEYTLEDKLPKLSKPMMFIWGRECYFGYQQAFDAVNANQRFSLMMLSDAGEWVHWEKPEIVNAAIHFFLESG